MDLSVKYMGLYLKNPIIVSSSDLTSSVENVKKCAEAGAGAVVLKSLFEEQILNEIDKYSSKGQYAFDQHPEATDYVQSLTRDHNIDEYLKLIEGAKKSVDIPVIASINCMTSREWPAFAAELQAAGADAIELNIGVFPFSEEKSSQQIEAQYVEILRAVKQHVKIPVAVKIGYYFSNIYQIARQLDAAGADAVVMFNRFYRPDIDIQNLNIFAGEILSTPSEMTQVLRWVGLLSGKVGCYLGASTGIHDGAGVIKQLLVGADATMVCSKLYRKGFSYIGSMLTEIEAWMESHKFETIKDFQGKLAGVQANTAEWERIQFIKKATGNAVKPLGSEW
ncbi:dihydroorotate dehydrogenase-like protein [Flammeovirgaceae bacterium SG7u.111]|nr:dihydroorotate dehydrogenase-like protein [Flammeovirgaceae bacterium SG7u.132]WPO33218.1 dihydroorotate dehydrogenase-like protein [Flammeovirgaceae bacterium SG7u.111]